jgi:hypothetical protein
MRGQQISPRNPGYHFLMEHVTVDLNQDRQQWNRKTVRAFAPGRPQEL